jgi:hypothetical protein
MSNCPKIRFSDTKLLIIRMAVSGLIKNVFSIVEKLVIPPFFNKFIKHSGQISTPCLRFSLMPHVSGFLVNLEVTAPFKTNLRDKLWILGFPE